MLRKLPDLTLVLAHLGGAAWKQSLSLAQEFHNVYFDCCEIIAWAGAPKAPTREELAQMIRQIGPDRVMMGSDFPWLSRLRRQTKSGPSLCYRRGRKMTFCPPTPGAYSPSHDPRVGS